jgi:hypothetical protein
MLKGDGQNLWTADQVAGEQVNTAAKDRRVGVLSQNFGDLAAP